MRKMLPATNVINGGDNVRPWGTRINERPVMLC